MPPIAQAVRYRNNYVTGRILLLFRRVRCTTKFTCTDDPGRSGFTLIELTVVVLVIMLLMRFLFTAGQGLIDRALKTQAKNDLTQIASCCKLSANLPKNAANPRSEVAGQDTTGTNGFDQDWCACSSLGRYTYLV